MLVYRSRDGLLVEHKDAPLWCHNVFKARQSYILCLSSYLHAVTQATESPSPRLCVLNHALTAAVASSAISYW
jgi:hypothetical protein